MKYLEDADFTLYNGDALEILKTLPAESVHMCVTSPPYWGLRDYSAEGQIGLEATPNAYIERMVAVFREVRRVLRSDGTCWVNMGDSYNSSPSNQMGKTGSGMNEGRPKYAEHGQSGNGERQVRKIPGLKVKDLCMIPARLALALQADGWWLRSQIVWSKPNPMPESVTDRPTTSHEFVYLLAKSPRYFFDQEAVREPNQLADTGWVKTRSRDGELHGDGQHAQDGNGTARVGRIDSGRNLRSVWEIATQPYPEAHFATYPEELVRRCILAGTSERGCCPECGAPWLREVERESSYDHKTTKPTELDRSDVNGEHDVRHGVLVLVKTIGWKPSCKCDELDDGDDLDLGFEYDSPPPIPCTVLDPFLGSGTTALVARKHGRRTIGIELSAEYCELAARRTHQLSLEAV